MKRSMLMLAVCLALSTGTAAAAPAAGDASQVAAEMARGSIDNAATSRASVKSGAAVSQRGTSLTTEAAAVPATSATPSSPDYLLRPGDQLSIVVTQQQELGNSSTNQTPFTVRPDGNVSFPLVGEIHAEGMTVASFTDAIADALSRYIVNPAVTVNITKLGTVRVYVFGEAKKPGAFELDKGHTVMDAIGAAEGFTRDTAKKKIFLIHQDEPKSLIPVNLNNMLRTGDMSENYVMREGDILYLTRNHRIDFARDIAPIFNSIYLVTEVKDNT
ncbi:polysaccharide biosynthesis/export family protein [Mitsuokella multacida]|uniref:polysaccharide biosynthesis/export family protein n=1 Tax=Mitsuokella multacida TaxID=52226 RepID=UPI0022E3375E|nr:polysaccharide biosynthesis/export family protein [Mitsuokella multacida]